ncbi:MAG: enoyl-CoA hydratase/isomerase family protein [Planctomycetes bacterium]|nr:enoyl-CoA hydratase/isomerase family protein [Planctomycetota bacterium]
MSKQGFDVQVQARVASVTLAGPPLNVLGTALQKALAVAVDALAAQDDVNLLVLQSGLENIFSAGADVREHLGRENVQPLLQAAHGLMAALLRFPVPTLCAVDGPCLGGALELLLACDQWLISDRASLGLPEITLGCYPPAAIVLAPQKLPAPLAAEMIQHGAILPGAEFAARSGAKLTPTAQFAGELQSLANHAGALPRGPLVEATRLLRGGAAARFLAAVGGVESAYLERLLALPDATEGPRAFLAKSKPRWNHQSHR